MEYKFTQDIENYEMYASGGILYASPGHPTFPIRLTNEIFRRCLAYRRGISDRYVIYDPCCGGAYHLTVLAYFNWDKIDSIIASDIDSQALGLATRNLSLLEPDGLDKRTQEISAMYQQFGKASHLASLEHAHILKQQLSQFHQNHPIPTRLFRADATNPQAIQTEWINQKVDIILTDLPYGWHSDWHPDTLALTQEATPTHQLLSALLPILSPHAVVAIATNKQDKIKHEQYQRLEKLSVGKRQVVILRPLAESELKSQMTHQD